MSLEWHDLLGGLGVASILAAYGLLQVGRIRAEDLGYSISNWLGAALVLVSLSYEFNLSAAVLESTWLVLSTVGIVRWWRSRGTDGTQG